MAFTISSATESQRVLRLAAITTAMVASLQGSSIATELPGSISTVKDLLYFCDAFAKSSSTDDVIRSGICFGYVTGAVQTNRAYSITFSEIGLPPQICLTDQDNVAAMINDMIAYLRKQPDMTLATTAVAKFLIEKHSCK